MKKLLLTLAVVLGFAVANATTVTYKVGEATAIDGSEVATNGGGYQPLNSCKYGDFTFTFSSTGMGTSDKPGLFPNATTPFLQLYKFFSFNGTTITVAAPEGVKINKLAGTVTEGIDSSIIKDCSDGVTGSFGSNNFTVTADGGAQNISFMIAGGFESLKVSEITIDYTGGEGGGGETPSNPDPTCVFTPANGSTSNDLSSFSLTFTNESLVQGVFQPYDNIYIEYKSGETVLDLTEQYTVKQTGSSFTFTAKEGKAPVGTGVFKAEFYNAFFLGINEFEVEEIDYEVNVQDAKGNAVAKVIDFAGALASCRPAQGVIDLQDWSEGVGHIILGVNGPASLRSDYASAGKPIQLFKGSDLLYDITMAWDIECFPGNAFTSIGLYFGNATITDPGNYTVKIPAGTFLNGIDTYSALELNFTIAAAEQFWVANPEGGSTASNFKTFSITFPKTTSVSMVEDFEDYAYFTYDNKDVTSDWVAAVDGNTITFTVKPGLMPTGYGEFNASFINCLKDADGKFIPNFTYIVNVAGGVNPTFDLDRVYSYSNPPLYSIDDLDYPQGLKTVRIVFDGNISYNQYAAETSNVTIKQTNDDDVVVYNEVVPKDKMQLIYNDVNDETSLEIDLGFEPTDFGRFNLNIGPGYFLLNGTAPNLESIGDFVWRFEHNDVPTFMGLVESINPAEGTIDLTATPTGVGVIKFTLNDGVSLNPHASKIYLYKEGETEPVYEVGTPDIEYGQGTLTMYMGSDETPTIAAPGKYSLVIPDYAFIAETTDALLLGVTLEWLIEEPVVIEKPELPVPACSLKATVETLEEVNVITLTLAEGETATIADEYLITVAPVIEGTPSAHIATYTAKAEGNTVVLTATPALTEIANADYVLTISPKAYETANGVSGTYAFNFSVAIPDSSVAGIAAAESYTVYTLDGVCVLANAEADALNTLSNGLYIVNGVKVLVSK